MATFGGTSPFPASLGGGNSPMIDVYNDMYRHVGVNNTGAEGSIIEEWRLSRARGIAASQAFVRAFYNGFPETSTDKIKMYEDMLGITAGAGDTEQDRRDRIVNLWYSIDTAITSDLEGRLQEIDPNFSILELNRVYASATVQGRPFGDFNPADPSACGPAFGGGRSSSDYANYSSGYICFVRYDITAGTITDEQIKRIALAEEILQKSLPAWCDYVIATSVLTGFILDRDLLDIGAFST